MNRPVAVLRPEPGNTTTCDRVIAAGLVPVRLPLFELVPIAWAIPDPAAFDAILMTSAATPRLGGPGLDALLTLPVVAVGPATAAAARIRGFTVVAEGEGGVDAAVPTARAAGFHRLLHLTGRDHVVADAGATVAVYASDALSVAPVALAALENSVALVHSARAMRRLAQLVPDAAARARVSLVMVSAAAAAGSGPGWRGITVAATPSDAAMVALARTLAIDPVNGPSDKTA